MREIKFRFWDTVEEKWMTDGREETGIYDFAFKQNMNWRFLTKEQAINRVIVEQYTGLKDKNGKEIYEGDIVKSTATKVKTPRVKICEWEGIGFDPFVADCEHSGDGWHWEIIGDIHTTPELLEKPK